MQAGRANDPIVIEDDPISSMPATGLEDDPIIVCEDETSESLIPAPSVQEPHKLPATSPRSSKRMLQPRKNKKHVQWTPQDHAKFLQGLERFGLENGLGPSGAELMAFFMGTRTTLQVKSHMQKYLADKAAGRTSCPSPRPLSPCTLARPTSQNEFAEHNNNKRRRRSFEFEAADSNSSSDDGASNVGATERVDFSAASAGSEETRLVHAHAQNGKGENDAEHDGEDTESEGEVIDREQNSVALNKTAATVSVQEGSNAEKLHLSNAELEERSEGTSNQVLPMECDDKGPAERGELNDDVLPYFAECWTFRRGDPKKQAPYAAKGPSFLPCDDACNSSADCIGVYDGVGGGGAKSGVFARLLASHVDAASRALQQGLPVPEATHGAHSMEENRSARMLRSAHREAARDFLREEQGWPSAVREDGMQPSTTAAILSLPVHRGSTAMHALQSGDTQWVLLRPSTPQQFRVVHFSDAQYVSGCTGRPVPYQLGLSRSSFEREMPPALCSVEVEDGDVVLVASDGFFDNFHNGFCTGNRRWMTSALEEHCNAAARACARAPGQQTLAQAFGRSVRDFATKMIDRRCARSKPDDVTVLVARVAFQVAPAQPARAKGNRRGCDIRPVQGDLAVGEESGFVMHPTLNPQP